MEIITNFYHTKIKNKNKILKNKYFDGLSTNIQKQLAVTVSRKRNYKVAIQKLKSIHASTYSHKHIAIYLIVHFF